MSASYSMSGEYATSDLRSFSAQREEPIATPPATKPWDDATVPILLGESAAIRRLRSQVQRIAPYLRTALIRGERGAGKQLVARAFHTHGPCAGGPFIVTDATSLAETIASQTTLSPATTSLLASANGGTLYLEGVGELPYPLQSGLFRFLQFCDNRRSSALTNRGELPRSDFLRNDTPLPDTRILSASHRDLRTLSAIGQFRPDLYARLSVVEIFVPPLRQRSGDIAALGAWFLRDIASRSGRHAKTLAQATLTQLEKQHWPNNLRELGRVLTDAAELADGLTIEPSHLLALAEQEIAPTTPTSASGLERLQDVLQHHVFSVLARCGGNKLRAAELLGISRSTLYRMLDANPGASREFLE